MLFFFDFLVLRTLYSVSAAKTSNYIEERSTLCPRDYSWSIGIANQGNDFVIACLTTLAHPSTEPLFGIHDFLAGVCPNIEDHNVTKNPSMLSVTTHDCKFKVVEGSNGRGRAW